jgi:hypothetical protein
VDAVQTDIQLQFNRARGQLQLENEIEAQNYNTALYELFQGGRDKLIDAVEPPGASDAAIVGKAAISAIGTYYGDKMSLGLGRQSATTPTAAVAEPAYQPPIKGPTIYGGPIRRGGLR